MTTGIELGTSLRKEEVYKAVESVGFNKGEKPVLHHENIDELRVQVHNRAFLKGIEGVVTEIELDDCSERFPDNPEAMQVLRDLYNRILDLVYLTISAGEVLVDGKKPEVANLSEYFDTPIEYKRRIVGIE